MRRLIAACALSTVIAGAEIVTAQQARSGRQPFKLGTFERSGRAFVGIVVRDAQVIDFAEANAAYERRNASASKVRPPVDMKELIERYDTGVKDRIGALVADMMAAPTGTTAFVYDVKSLKVLPPVRPAVILNAGGNYEEHSQGIAQQQQRAGAAAEPTSAAVTAPGIWERKAGDTRDNPYLFLKSPSVVIGAYDPIKIPAGRTQIDFECEFDTVIGKAAKRVPIERAADYIFGYTIQIDVSDRGGRGDRKMGGSDWLIGKNHDTFGPLGPYIVPREFMPDPKNVRHTFTLNGQVMQDSTTSRMSHNVYELLHYASNILTLNAGDVISGGSPAGTNIERAEPRWMRAGDTAVCTIEGIGTQTHSVVADTPTTSR
jgi:2-keto-4-pentenoate hydratase/2-oxohepta-3-ene-1,7-dioic acid hydratase in catechol pathway